MPRPVYIICASDVCEDRNSSLVSLFTILEQVQIARVVGGANGVPCIQSTPVPSGIQMTQMKVMAVWMKQPGDTGDFEHEFALEFGDSNSTLVGAPFTFSDDAILKRFMLTVNGFPVPDQSGLAYIRSRIRSVDATEWLSQDFPLLVTLIDVPAELANNSPPQT